MPLHVSLLARTDKPRYCFGPALGNSVTFTSCGSRPSQRSEKDEAPTAEAEHLGFHLIRPLRRQGSLETSDRALILGL